MWMAYGKLRSRKTWRWVTNPVSNWSSWPRLSRQHKFLWPNQHFELQNKQNVKNNCTTLNRANNQVEMRRRVINAVSNWCSRPQLSRQQHFPSPHHRFDPENQQNAKCHSCTRPGYMLVQHRVINPVSNWRFRPQLYRQLHILSSTAHLDLENQQNV